MINDDLWAEIEMHEFGGMLCIHDVEKRLGRFLNWQDFQLLPMNYYDDSPDQVRSAMFVDRAGKPEMFMERIIGHIESEEPMNPIALKWVDTHRKEIDAYFEGVNK